MIKKSTIFVLSIALLFSIAGCGNDKTETNTTTTKKVTTAKQEELRGKVIVDGSGTVYPLMAHIAEEYMTNVQSKVSVQVGRAGSSAGFKKFIPGETDFSDASRKIKDTEKTELEEKGLMLGEQISRIQACT